MEGYKKLDSSFFFFVVGRGFGGRVHLGLVYVNWARRWRRRVYIEGEEGKVDGCQHERACRGGL